MTVSISIVMPEVDTVQAALLFRMVVAPCLTVKPHPDRSFVTEPSVYAMKSCVLLFSSMRSLTLFRLLAILDSVFPGFLAGVSRRDAGIGLGTFPTPWFA